MSNAEVILAKKDFAWNIGIFIIALALLATGFYLGMRLVDPAKPAESLRVIAIAEAIPVFFIIATYRRLSAETIGALSGAILGFALGKVG